MNLSFGSRALAAVIFSALSMTPITCFAADVAPEDRTRKVKLELDQWYRLSRTTSVIPQEASDVHGNPVDINNSVILKSGTDINVLEFSPKGDYALITVEDGSEDEMDVSKEFPETAWVNITDLVYGNPTALSDDQLENESDGIAMAETNGGYNDLPNGTFEVALIARKFHKRRGGRRANGMTYCLRDVRTAGCGNSPLVEYASLAYTAYKNLGWRPIEFSRDVPTCTACFSTGGRKSCGRIGCGHAAVKIGANKWKGAGVRPDPWLHKRKGDKTRYEYNPVGCLVAPGH
jgi:hypothetical protein